MSNVKWVACLSIGILSFLRISNDDWFGWIVLSRESNIVLCQTTLHYSKSCGIRRIIRDQRLIVYHADNHLLMILNVVVDGKEAEAAKLFRSQ